MPLAAIPFKITRDSLSFGNFLKILEKFYTNPAKTFCDPNFLREMDGKFISFFGNNFPAAFNELDDDGSDAPFTALCKAKRFDLIPDVFQFPGSFFSLFRFSSFKIISQNFDSLPKRKKITHFSQFILLFLISYYFYYFFFFLDFFDS